MTHARDHVSGETRDMVGDFTLKDRYLLPCQYCQGAGCLQCAGHGQIPVYIIETGVPAVWCTVTHHKLIGSIERATDAKELPLIAWCLRSRCTWKRIQTDTPAAYGLEPLEPPIEE